MKSDQGNLIERSQERLAIDFSLGSLEWTIAKNQGKMRLPPVVIPLAWVSPGKLKMTAGRSDRVASSRWFYVSSGRIFSVGEPGCAQKNPHTKRLVDSFNDQFISLQRELIRWSILIISIRYSIVYTGGRRR